MKPLTQAEIVRLEADIAAELPELSERAGRRQIAIQEDSVSGQLRRGLAGRKLRDVAGIAGVDIVTLADWMSGDASLPSDAIDRLARELKMSLHTEAIG